MAPKFFWPIVVLESGNLVFGFSGVDLMVLLVYNVGHESDKNLKYMNRREVWIVAIIVLVLGAIAYPQLNNYLTIRNANPEMVKLAKQADMTRRGELIFLKTNPQLVESETALKADCPEFKGNGWAGCYSASANDPTTGRIYLLDMPADLHQILVATAAYEMLHPVYAKIHTPALDSMIQSNYNSPTIQADTVATADFAELTAGEPSPGDDELFSLLLVYDYQNLSGDLQNAYTPYLSNPAAVETDNNYVTATVAGYKSQISSLNTTIAADDAAAQSWYNASSGDDSAYQTYIQDNNTANGLIDQANALVSTANALVNEYNSQLGL